MKVDWVSILSVGEAKAALILVTILSSLLMCLARLRERCLFMADVRLRMIMYSFRKGLEVILLSRVDSLISSLRLTSSSFRCMSFSLRFTSSWRGVHLVILKRLIRVLSNSLLPSS